MELGPWYQRFIIDGKPTTKVGFMNSDYFALIEPLFYGIELGTRVLDIGCNAGFVSFELSKKGAFVLGIENDEGYYNQAIYMRDLLENPVVNFKLSDIETFNMSGWKPEFVVALGCLYHLKNPTRTCQRIVRLKVPIVASFRYSNFSSFINIFNDLGLEPKKVINYGRKLAVRFN